jgi:Arc/MetJ-type ribon-helix-helix transcriptional regulator
MGGKQAISVTLDAENVTWLKGRAGRGEFRSVSDLVNRLIGAARASGQTAGGRSVVGTIDIDASDPLLAKADAAVRSLYEASLARPLLMREKSAEYQMRPRKKRRG